MLYKLLKAIVNIGLYFYYKEIRINNREELPESGAVILLGNHPNTLIDAWVVGVISKRKPFFMAKATFFNSPFKAKLLKRLGMIPINRKSDGVVSGVSNDDSFKACYELLEEQEVLAIFPEGSSYQERQLRELKSGAARIALNTLLRNGKDFNLKLIPIGINYLDPEKFRSNIVVNIGQTINASDFYTENPSEIGKNAKALTQRIRTNLQHCLVSSENKEEEELVSLLQETLQSKYADGADANSEVDFLRKIRDRIVEFQLTQPYKLEEVRQLCLNLNSEVQENKINSSFLDRRIRKGMFFRQVIFSIVFLLLAFPIFVYGLVHNFIQYFIVDKMVMKISKEVEYYASIAVLISLFVYPITYGIFVFILNFLVEIPWWADVIYYFSMPITGLFAYFFFHYGGHIYLKTNYLKFIGKNRINVELLKKKKDRLRQLMLEN